MMAGLIPANLNHFIPYAKYEVFRTIKQNLPNVVLIRFGNFTKIRMISMDAIIHIDGLSTKETTLYLLDVIRRDPCLELRYHVARAMTNYVSLAAHQYNQAGNNGNGPNKTWNVNKKRIENDKEICESLWNMMKYKNPLLFSMLITLIVVKSFEILDFRIKYQLLRFCEVVFDPYIPPPTKSAAVPKLVLKVSNSAAFIPDFSAIDVITFDRLLFSFK